MCMLMLMLMIVSMIPSTTFRIIIMIIMIIMIIIIIIIIIMITLPGRLPFSVPTIDLIVLNNVMQRAFQVEIFNFLSRFAYDSFYPDGTVTAV